MFTQVGSEVHFLANRVRLAGPYIHQWELWKTDGSQGGTQYVENLIRQRSKYSPQPGEYNSNKLFGDEYSELIAFDNQLYFTGNDLSSWALWKTNGDADAADRLNTLLPGSAVGKITNLAVFNNHLFFFADDGSGHALWRLAPGENSADPIMDGLTEPGQLTVLLGGLFFSNKNDEIWRSTGDAAGTHLVTVVTGAVSQLLIR